MRLAFEIRDALDDTLRARWQAWARSPFSSPGYFAAWRSAFATTRRAFVIVGMHEDTPVLVLPMYHQLADASAWYGLGEFRCDYSELAAVSEDLGLARALWAWLLGEAPCRLLKLSRIPSASALGRTAPAPGTRSRIYGAASTVLRHRRVRYHDTRTEAEHPYADRAQIEEAATRLESKSTRRNTQYLARSGPISYEVVRGEAVTALLPAFFDMHVRSFGGRGKASQFEDPIERGFFASLVREVDSVTMDVLSAGTTPIAMHFGFAAAGTIYYYKPVFEMALAKHSPGRVLLAQLFARAAREGATRVDLLKGGEAYKQDWASGIQPTVTATIVERKPRELVGGMAKRLRGHLTRKGIFASLPLS